MADSRRSSFRVPMGRLVFGVLLVLAVWVTFFDTHSVVQRTKLHLEARALERENAALQAQIDSARSALAQPLSDVAVEQQAREQYGMRRPGETVYRVEESE